MLLLLEGRDAFDVSSEGAKGFVDFESRDELASDEQIGISGCSVLVTVGEVVGQLAGGLGQLSQAFHSSLVGRLIERHRSPFRFSTRIGDAVGLRSLVLAHSSLRPDRAPRTPFGEQSAGRTKVSAFALVEKMLDRRVEQTAQVK